MGYRCKTARILGEGILNDYKLLFKGSPNNAYATIEESKGDYVPILVWELKPEDEKSLDKYEGYPIFYYKKDVVVKVEEVGEVEAMVYIMDKKREIGIPSKRYYEVLREGYKKFGFDMEILKEALEHSRENIKEIGLDISRI